jgi:UDP-3-O-[3-hydroxymyristoyl] glucosamine N-acyltransferase
MGRFAHSCVSESARIADNVRVGRFVVIEDDVEISSGCVIEDFSLIQSGSTIGPNTKVGTYSKIGRNVRIGSACSFTAYCEIRDDCRLGDRVLMGSRCTLSAGTLVEDDVVMKYSFVVADTPVLSRNDEKLVGHLKKRSRFGACVVIMPGVTVGEDAEIGACSQVRHDVPDHEVWFGIPAKVYRKGGG